MQIGPLTIVRRDARLTTLGDLHHDPVVVETKALPPLTPLSGRGGWWSVIRESFTGAWQRNVEVRMDTVLTYSAVFACVTLIASDIAKLALRLVEEDIHHIWTPTESPSFSPVLRKPNRYQTRIKFIEQWITSKLIHGNTYVLKERDGRGLVKALYILDPTRVTPLVATDGSVYYELQRDDLSGLPVEARTVPAREIIHDTMVCLYHPLIGVSPIYACGVAAMQGLSIQQNSSKFFANGSQPGGVLTAPATIDDATAERIKAYWDANFSGDNVGKVAVLGDDLKYMPLSVNAVDAQLIEQLNWTGTTVCSCFHVQPYMIGIGDPPPYANVEPLLQQYYAQALQNPIECLELLLDEGMGLGPQFGNVYGTEFDLDDLFRMDTATRSDAAAKAIGSGGMSPNEARFKYFDLGPVEGGDTPYMQQQQFSLRALNQRDQAAPAPSTITPPPAPSVPVERPHVPPADLAASFAAALQRKAVQAELLHAA